LLLPTSFSLFALNWNKLWIKDLLQFSIVFTSAFSVPSFLSLFNVRVNYIRSLFCDLVMNLCSLVLWFSCESLVDIVVSFIFKPRIQEKEEDSFILLANWGTSDDLFSQICNTHRHHLSKIHLLCFYVFFYMSFKFYKCQCDIYFQVPIYLFIYFPANFIFFVLQKAVEPRQIQKGMRVLIFTTRLVGW